jgi:uncharacterized repeat protein (TIGR03803 family)
MAFHRVSAETSQITHGASEAQALTTYRGCCHTYWMVDNTKMCRFNFRLTIAMSIALCASTAESQTFKTLLSFTGTGGAAVGANPYGNLTVSGTTLYGMTGNGGVYGNGNAFSVAMDGTSYVNLVSFTGTSGSANGWGPEGSLTLIGTTLFGMTEEGGTAGVVYSGLGAGNIFSVSTDGTNYQNLVSFTGLHGPANGVFPLGNVALSGTRFYGTTQQGGNGNGNLFSLGVDGSDFQNLIAFTGSSGTASGRFPGYGTLARGGTTLYGMTLQGGASGFGNVFSVGLDGSNYQSLLSFTGSGSGGTANGRGPWGSLVLGDTTLYGMTRAGGAYGYGNVFSVGSNGSNYQNLVSFTGSGSGIASGGYPDGSLILSGTTLYGMTLGGGTDGAGYGNIFSMGIDGSGFHDLYDFTGGTDGGLPVGDLTLSGGTLFGMSQVGGAYGDGTIFALVLPAPTPEPGTLALLGGGVAALVSYRWRRRRRM